MNKETFLKTVQNHTMTIINDDGVNRHLRFKEDGTNNRWFDIVTWKGHLCITGDMGCAVYTRLNDMFEFFDTGEDIGINVNYWTEKEVATSVFGKNYEFDSSVLPELLKEWRERWIEENDPTEEQIEDVEYELKDTDFGSMCEVSEFLHNPPEVLEHIIDQDWWENKFETVTGHHIWRLFAITYAVREYKKYKGEPNDQIT